MAKIRKRYKFHVLFIGIGLLLCYNVQNGNFEVMVLKELKAKILEALVSALPITAIVYLVSLLPWFDFTKAELISFTIGAVLLILGIGLFNLGADLAMTPMGTQVGAGLSRQRKLGLLLAVCFVLGMLITIADAGKPG